MLDVGDLGPSTLFAMASETRRGDGGMISKGKLGKGEIKQLDNTVSQRLAGEQGDLGERI